LHPLDEATLDGAIRRLTLALLAATDEEIADLISARRDLRDELPELRERGAGVARLDDERAKRGGPR
jgi:hypothetical protein